MSIVESAYQQGIDSMTPAERMARVESFLHWTRDLIARQVTQELGEEISDERLKCEIALRMYDSDPRVERLIREHLARVSS